MTALNHALPTPWFRRRKLRRVVIGLAVTGLIIGFAAWMWGPETYRRMRILHWQGRVMEHRELPGTVRYTYVIGGGESDCECDERFVS